jgi:PAS domain S-box-containing protein
MIEPLNDDSPPGERLNLLETLFDRMPMGIAIFDRDYRLRRCNPTWAEFIERHGPPSAKPAVPGTAYSDLAPGAESTAYPLFERVLQGETIKQQALRLETGKNVSFWDLVLAPLVDDGEVSSILNVTIDATERVRAEQELRRHRDRLEEMVSERTAELRLTNQELQRERDFSSAVLDTAGALVVVLDRKGRIVRFNQACEETTGWGVEEVKGKPFWDLFLLEEETEPVKAVFHDLKEGYFPADFENYWLTKTGERRLISWSSTALLDDEGTVEYVISTGIDVTERTQAEEELQRAHVRLEQQVARRTAQLRRRVAFENLVSTISTDFINRAPEEIDEGINQALEAVGEFMDVDRSYVFLYSGDKRMMDNTHEWCAEGITPQIERMKDVPVEDLEWSNEILLRGDVLHIPSIADLPPEASAEKAVFQAQDVRSLVAVPLVYQGETIGLVGFDAVREERTWPDESIKLLVMLAAILVNAMERKRAEAIQDGQRQFLELLATGTDFSETLHTLVSIIEDQWPGMQALVLTLDEDGQHLHRGAAVSLPEAYVESIEGLEIGPMVGSCGTASYLGERVIVEDIAEDPRWDGLRDLALDHGLRACWSQPVFSSAGDVIGTFAMYYRHPRAPTAAELEAIEIGAHLAGVAIERKRADEALRESERMLSTLISNLPGMAYRSRNDRDWTMEFVSEGSLELTGYRPDELIGNRHISYGQLIHPDDREAVWEDVQAALRDDRPFEITYRLLTPEGQRWVWERGQGVTSPQGDLEALEGFVTDITERVTARRHLEQRVEERTHELSTLLDVSHNVASTLELEPLLGLILEQLKPVVDYDAASVMVLEEEELRLLAYRGPIPQEEALQIRFDVADAGVNRAVIERREPVLIPDVCGDSELAEAFRETAGDEMDTTFSYIRSWMGVPLIVKEKLVGMLALDHSEPDYYTPHRAEMAKAFAAQAATAMENARLFEAEQERLEESERRRQVAEGLREVLAVLNTDRPLTEVLDTIVGQACRLLRSEAGAVYQLSRAEESIQIEATCHMPDGFLDIGSLPLIDTEPNRATLNREPFAVPDVQARLHDPRAEDLKVDPSVRSWAEIVGNHFRSYLSVPIVVRDDVYGAMSLFYERRRQFSAEEIDLAMTLADQAALAIENARLRVQAEKSAAAAERSRLARDLHDAVTQTLFSSSLIADVLPRIWEKSPEQGRERLQELRELTRGALAEMRTLLLELRPAALTDAEMSELLRQLAESITGRARVPVDVSIEEECTLPVDVKVALYRIAQESLNNVAKHAGASQATVRMRCGEHVELEVVDDGLGFDIDSVPPDSLGLGIMRERAKDIGAELTVESEVGEGTRVYVRWTADAG